MFQLNITHPMSSARLCAALALSGLVLAGAGAERCA